MASPDYGVEYATIESDGSLRLDLSPERVTGPTVPCIRVLRIWLERALGRAIERTFTATELGALGQRLRVLAENVEHVLRAAVVVTLGEAKALIVRGELAVGGARTYALNVTVDQLGGVLATISG
jgi:hypothetical protein